MTELEKAIQALAEQAATAVSSEQLFSAMDQMNALRHKLDAAKSLPKADDLFTMLLNGASLEDIAKQYGRSKRQIADRFCYARGTLTNVTAEERLRELRRRGGIGHIKSIEILVREMR
jgi:hypothetical protein